MKTQPQAPVSTGCRCLDESMHRRRAQTGHCQFEYSDVPPPPLIRQRETVNIGQTVNPAREKEFAHRFKHYGCTVKLIGGANRRWLSWDVEHTKSGAQQSTSFDSDMDRLLTQLAQGHALEHISLIPQSASVAVESSSNTTNLCAVCGEVGGLPCPAMLGRALGFKLKLCLTPAAWVANAYHVHPGRCRTRLRGLLETAAQIKSGVKTG